MSDSRYFLVKDKAIIEAIKANCKGRQTSRDKAQLFAKEHKLGDSIFSRFGIFDLHLSGFKSQDSEIDRSLMTKPKEGIFRPKRAKNSELSKAYSELCEETRISDKEIEEVLGWNHLTFFPSMPGCNFKPNDDLYVFILPVRVLELNGCEEISNIEYLDLFKSEGKAT